MARDRTRMAGIGVLAVVQGLVGLQPAGAQDMPHHVSVESSRYPWSSLAKIFNSVGGACTGAVVSRTRVLTAGHCLYVFRTRRFLPPDALHVLVGYDRGGYRVHARVARFRLGPGYDPEAERKTAASDWALLDLADPLPADIRPLALAPPGANPGGPVILAGFARDRAYVLTADETCRITGSFEGSSLISHDCMIQPGDSGAPLLARSSPDGEARILGVAVGIWHVGQREVGIAAPVPADVLDGHGTP